MSAAPCFLSLKTDLKIPTRRMAGEDLRLSPVQPRNTLLTVIFFSAVALAIGYCHPFPPAAPATPEATAAPSAPPTSLEEHGSKSPERIAPGTVRPEGRASARAVLSAAIAGQSQSGTCKSGRARQLPLIDRATFFATPRLGNAGDRRRVDRALGRIGSSARLFSMGAPCSHCRTKRRRFPSFREHISHECQAFPSRVFLCWRRTRFCRERREDSRKC